jgi:hypothetical protein
LDETQAAFDLLPAELAADLPDYLPSPMHADAWQAGRIAAAALADSGAGSEGLRALARGAMRACAASASTIPASRSEWHLRRSAGASRGSRPSLPADASRPLD